MAVATVGLVSSVCTGNLTKSFTSTGGPLYVTIGYFTSGGSLITGITYNGVALTKIAGTAASNGSDVAEIWRLANSAAGTFNLVITPSAGGAVGGFGIFNTAGQDTTTPEGTPTTAQSTVNGTSTGAQTIVGAGAGDLTVVVVTDGSGTAVTPSASGGGAVTERYDLTDSGEQGEMFTVADAVSTVTGSGFTSAGWALAAITLKAAAGSGTPARSIKPPQPITARLRTTVERQQAWSYLQRYTLKPGVISTPPSGVVVVAIPSTVLGNVKGATGGVAQHHLFKAKNTGRWWLITYRGAIDSGTATSGSTSALNDTGKSWTAGQYLGYACVITAGTGVGQWFTIGNNTATSLPVVDNGATGSWLATAIAAGSTYEIVEATRVRAYVSSGSDLSVATWSEAAGSPSPSTGDPANTLGYGFNLAGGKNNPGGYGEFPTDGRLIANAYADVGPGTDVIHLICQIDSHYIHATLRARITSATTIAWDANVHGGGGGSGWNDTAPGIEDAPDFPQSLAMGYSSTGRWWWINEENFQPIIGYTSGVADSGAANQDPAWTGTNGVGKPNTWDTALTSIGAPWQGAVIPLASGFMLAVYCAGTEAASAPSAGNTRQAGLRWAESASATAWPATNVGAAVPNLSATDNHPNDWGIVKVSDTDIHLIRRDTGTTLEQVRHSGHGGTWGAKVTLPTSGLTGHQAGSGVALVSDGTTVWCFVIDTDANHSIRYIKWAGGTWDTSWSTLATDNLAKDFLVAEIDAGNGIALAWTRGTGPYEVDVSWLSLAGGIVNLTRSASDSITALTDSAARVLSLPRLASDAPSVSDVATRALGLSRPASDALASISESVVRAALNFVRSGSDAPVLSDSTTRTVSLPRTAADSEAAITDVAVGQRGVLRTASDSVVAISESATRSALNFVRSAADAPVVSDLAGRTAAFVRSAADAPVISDVAVGARLIIRTASDSVSAISESATRAALHFVRSANDATSLSEVAARTLAFIRSASDAPVISDVAVGARLIIRTASDAITPISESAVRGALNLVRSATDASSLVDSVVRAPLNFARAAGDAPVIAEVASAGRAVVRTASDAIAAISDSAVAQVGHAFVRTASDAISPISDSAVRAALHFARAAGDAPVVTEAAAAVRHFVRSAGDVLGVIADVASRGGLGPFRRRLEANLPRSLLSNFLRRSKIDSITPDENVDDRIQGG